MISRGVTSCAGMTAQHVLLAQTKIGFLTGGRGNKFQELDDIEKQSQREEAFRQSHSCLDQSSTLLFYHVPIGHERPYSVKIQQLVTYKYLHKVRSAVLASASKHKIPKTRKPRQTWKRLFSQPTRKVRMSCNLLLRRKLCTTAGFLRSETCIHAINSPTQPQSSKENIMKSSSKLKYRLTKHNLLTKHR